MLEMLLPILIKYVLVPEIATIVKGNPQLTNEEIIAQLPADIRALALGNQSFLDSIRTQAGR